MNPPLILDTCQQIIDERIPNLFRLYINPYVAQSCFCLTRLAETTWPTTEYTSNRYQIFLANGLEEALSGAVKLARYAANLECGGPAKGLLVESDDPRMPFFASTKLNSGESVTFIPELERVSIAGSDDPLPKVRFCVVPILDASRADEWLSIQNLLQTHAPLKIVVATRETLQACRCDPTHPVRSIDPDIIVFDESFTNCEVPFSAFVAKRKLYDLWNRRGMKLFHSTTYQPNTISSLHFLRCLGEWEPEFVETLKPDLERLHTDFAYRQEQFASLYSANLTKLTNLANFDKPVISAEGHYVQVGEQRVFDGVGGVACSIRGHNPPKYIEEIQALEWEPKRVEDEVARRLKHLTDLDYVIPAVSGASAVETALKIGLMVKAPHSHIIALRGGFGGKTLLSLAGTWKPSLKRGIDPLYPHVSYIDPFRKDAVDRLIETLEEHPTGIVQLEVIQGVGGVRRIPQNVLDAIASERDRRGYLIFVDEVQTGFFRTGPFIASHEAGLQPDLLTLGKGASDMMFPYALMLYSKSIQAQLDTTGQAFIEAQRRFVGYSLGYKTVLNTLIRSEAEDCASKVRAAGQRFAELLERELKGSVKEVRCYGLLIGIELFQRKWCGRLAPQLALLNMLQDRDFPLLMGFCQYEPHVLKFTPPLTTDDAEIEELCSTIARTLRIPLYRSLTGVLARTLSTRIRRHQ